MFITLKMVLTTWKIVFLLLFSGILNVTNAQKRVLGKNCTVRSEGTKSAGTCILAANCPSDRPPLVRRICGSNGPSVPLFCCPVPTVTENAAPDIVTKMGSNNELNQVEFGRQSNKYCLEQHPKETGSYFIGGQLISVTNKDVCTERSEGLIVGGKDSMEGEFPFMAALGISLAESKKFICGGTLITNQFVLTAAHCTYARDLGSPDFVRMGDTNLASTDDDRYAQDFPIGSFILHEGYTGKTHYHDIALLKLRVPIRTFTQYIKPACMWTKSNFDTTVNATAAGWGTTATQESSDKLQKVGLEIYENILCENALKFKTKTKLLVGVSDEMLCSGYLKGGKDSCQGDSGGPLLIKKNDGECNDYIIGVTSFGAGCAAKNTPGVYTRVSSYIPWIEKHVWPTNA